jgi:hypothetical protein
MIEMDELNQQSITGHNLFFALPRRLISHKLQYNLDMQNKSQNAGSERG